MINESDLIKEVRPIRDLRVGDRFFRAGEQAPIPSGNTRWNTLNYRTPNHPYGYAITHIDVESRFVTLETNHFDTRELSYFDFKDWFIQVSRKFKVPNDNLSKEIREINQMGYKYQQQTGREF